MPGRASAKPRLLQIDNFAASRRRIWRFGRTNRPLRKRGACWLARYKRLRFSIAQNRAGSSIVALKAERGDRTDTRHGHKPADLRIMASQFHNLAVKLTDLLPDGIARFEQRSDSSYQLRTALD